jgi:4-hydroxy-2-oxoheptanedioate aldolase
VRTNTLKAKLRAGERVVGTILGIHNPELIEIFGHLGYDFVFIDGQHGGLSLETARECMRAAELTGMSTLVRVPRNEPSIILEYLDAGAGGIIVPDVMTRAETEAAYRAIKYAPEGNRGAMTGSRAAFYGITQSAPEYLQRANEETMFVPLLEHQNALGVLPDIMSVDGIDLVAIGPSDLALSMGIPGGWTDPRVQTEVDNIIQAARSAGLQSMVVALDHEDGRKLIDRGVQALLVASGSVIANGARDFLKALRA